MNTVNEVLEIFDCEFEDDSGLLKLKVKDRRTKILELPETINGKPLKIIGASMFVGKQIRAFELPPQLEKICDYAFSANLLEEVIIPRGCTHIGHYAFGDNQKLSRVVLPPSLEFIDEAAFDDTTGYLITVCQEGSYAHKYALNDGGKIEVLSEEEFNKLYEL